MSEEISREQIALTMFCATLERTIDKADRMAFKEGVVKVAKEQIAAAYLLADIWIAERQINIKGKIEKPTTLTHNGVGIADMYSREEYENAMRSTN